MSDVAKTLQPPEPASPRAQEAMRCFDEHTLARLYRTRFEGQVSLASSVALALAALALQKNTSRLSQAYVDEITTVHGLLLISGFVLSAVAVIRSFQAAALPDRNWFDSSVDNFAILWVTVYFVWVVAGMSALWA